jgi:LEA14-like dessication related protein
MMDKPEPWNLRHRGIPSLFLAAVAALTGCETLMGSGFLNGVAKPSIEAIAPRITGIDLDGVKLAFDVGVNNPYAVPIKSPRFNYAMSIADTPLISESAETAIDLPAKGVGTVTLPVAMKYSDIWNVARQLKDANEIPYTLKGNLLASAMGKDLALPLEKSGKAPVLRMPTFSEMKLAEPEVGLGRAKVAMDMAVSNPNVFGIGLEDLGYALKIGDVEVGGISASSPKELGAGESGKVKLTGAISGMDVIGKLLSGGKLGVLQLATTGSIKTPYGNVGAK